MSRDVHPARKYCALAFLTLAVAATAVAQQREKDGTDTPLRAELVKTGLYLISGGGANTLLRFSAIGSIVVDGKAPGQYRPLMSQIRKLSRFGDLPVRVLVLTDHHEDRTGTNAQFAAAKVTIVTHENVKRRLGGAMPAITYTREYPIRMGGIEVRLMHFGNAHTDGDSVAYFPNLGVVAVGDLFTRGTPGVDFAAGGSLVNWGAVLGEVLKLDFDTAVPGSGPAVSKADVQVFKTKLDTLVARAGALVKSGVPKDRLMAELRTDDLGWQFTFAGDDIDRFYDELAHAN